MIRKMRRGMLVEFGLLLLRRQASLELARIWRGKGCVGKARRYIREYHLALGYQSRMRSVAHLYQLHRKTRHWSLLNDFWRMQAAHYG